MHQSLVYLDYERILIGLRFGSIVSLRIVGDLIKETRQFGRSEEGRRSSYQGAVANKLGKVLVFTLVDLLFQDTESHWFLDNIVVVGDQAFVDAALEQSRGIMTTAAQLGFLLSSPDLKLSGCTYSASRKL